MTNVRSRSTRAKQTPRLPLIEVGGDPERMGFELGSKCKDSIREVVQKVYTIVTQYSPSIASREQFLKLTRQFVPPAEAYAPDLVQEIRGIASGAGVTFEEVFALNTIKEITYGAKSFLGSTGCSNFVAGPEATLDKTVILGQNGDWWSPFTKHFILLVMKPSKGPAIVTATIAGLIVYISQNSDGLCTLANGLISKDERLGVPFEFVWRKVMEQRKLGDAVGLVLETPRATAANLVVVDKEGEGYDLELSGRDQDVSYVDGGIFAHSNHYLSPNLRPVQDISWIPDTILRVNRMRRLLQQRFGKVGLADAERALSDHHNYPESICRHVDDADRPENQWESSVSVIMQPAESKFHTCHENPCKGRYFEYTLG